MGPIYQLKLPEISKFSWICFSGNLSSGRVGIVTMANSNLHSAVVIGIRYSAARKQFGPETGTVEMSVIEYETQKCRIFPFLAAAFALHHFANSLGADMLRFFMARMNKEGKTKLLKLKTLIFNNERWFYKWLNMQEGPKKVKW